MKTYGELRFVTKVVGAVTQRQWVIDAEPHVHLRAKRVFGRLSKQARGDLFLSHSSETCRDLEWFCDRYPLAISDADRTVLLANATEHRDRIQRTAELLDANYQPPSFALALPARSYQAREAHIYLLRRRLLIADDVGLGKTAAAICSFVDARALPAVVVTLTHLTAQWEQEVKKFAPALNVHQLRKGSPYELPKFFGHGPDVVVLNYHKLAGWARVLREYAHSIVFDEIQELRRRDSNKYTAADHLAGGLDFRLGLSATPIYNFGGEIFNVLNVLEPGCLGDRSEFVQEWCTEAAEKDKERIKNPAAFGAWLREECLMVRHTRREVGRELPAVTTIVHTIDSDAAALDRVQNSAAELAKIILARAETERGAKWHAAEQLTILLRQATGVSKAPYVADFVRLLVESGESVVLFGWHREVYDIWRTKLADLKPVFYTGSESPVQKENAAMRFRAGDTKVIILSLRAGAGLNGLQEVSSVAVFGELDWSPGVHTQCVGRLNRDGQTSPVLSYFLVADRGADPAMSELLGLKREQVEGLINPGDARELTDVFDIDPQRAKRLATAYLKQLGHDVPDEAVA